MESQPQNPKYRNNSENIHTCGSYLGVTPAFLGTRKMVIHILIKIKERRPAPIM